MNLEKRKKTHTKKHRVKSLRWWKAKEGGEGKWCFPDQHGGNKLSLVGRWRRTVQREREWGQLTIRAGFTKRKTGNNTTEELWILKRKETSKKPVSSADQREGKNKRGRRDKVLV